MLIQTILNTVGEAMKVEREILITAGLAVALALALFVVYLTVPFEKFLIMLIGVATLLMFGMATAIASQQERQEARDAT